MSLLCYLARYIVYIDCLCYMYSLLSHVLTYLNHPAAVALVFFADIYPLTDYHVMSNIVNILIFEVANFRESC